MIDLDRTKQREQLSKIPIEKLAFRNFRAYLALFYNSYRFAPHNLLIAEALMKIERGEIRRLIVTMPPRHGKTLMIGEYFPAWYIGRNPDRHIIYTTYSFDRATDVGRKVRNQMIDPYFYKIFPGCSISTDAKSANRITTTQNGYYFAVGVGGAVIGRGAHCCVGDTNVSTNYGSLEISEIAKHLEKSSFNTDLKVLSLNEDGVLEYNKIVAFTRNRCNEIYEIKTNSGYFVRTTGEHRFFVYGQGYRKAKDLQPGNKVVIAKNKVLQSLWKKTSTTNPISWAMLCLLQQNEIFKFGSYLLLLRKEIYKDGLRDSKSYQARAQRSLLFSKMFAETSCHKKSQEMRNLWSAGSKENNAFLFGWLQKKISKKKKTFTNILLSLWEEVSTNFSFDKILLQALPEQGSFNQNAWFEKFELQRWSKLRKTLRGNETFNFPKRLQPLCCLPKEKDDSDYCLEWSENQKNKFSCSSYRPRSNQQCSGKFNYDVSNLSFETSLIETDIISSVRKVCCESVEVYDIQVERTNNFFADGILVHNCFIIDDPIKSREEAESSIVRNKLIDWFKGVAYTRLMPGNNAMIIVQTRWHYDDLIGYLLKELPHENWTVLNLPAVCNSEDDLLGRQIGEALWSSDFPIDVLNNIKETVGTREWNAQYQQEPLAKEGRMVKLDDFKKYKYSGWLAVEVALKMGGRCRVPYDIKQIVMSWDTAFKEKKFNDFSACTVWGISKTNDFYLLNVINERLNYAKLRYAVVNAHQKYLKAGLGSPRVLIEDRGSGQSLIQDLNRNTRIPIIAVKANVNKQTRMDTASALIEAGRVWLPERAKWLVEYETQIARFPFTDFDDLVDSTSQFLMWVGKPKFKRSNKIKFWK